MQIQTQRLTIRNYREEDWVDTLEIFSDPQAMAFCEPPYDAEKTRELVSYFAQNPIAFAVVLRETGKVIGHALFKQLPGEADGVFEIGWIYNRAYWRQGYAGEGSRALLEYGFRELGLHKVCAETIDPVKSVGLMKKLGMVYEGTFHSHTRNPAGQWCDVVWYAILNPEE